MSTTYSDKNSRRMRSIIFAVLTVLVLAGVAFGVNYVWQQRFGPTPASAADCRLAQQLIDQAKSAPSEEAEAEAWEADIRKVRYAKLQDDGLSTQVGRYVSYARAKATGQGERPTADDFTTMKKEALGHCKGSGVELTIPEITF
jgi:hypothetical protein